MFFHAEWIIKANCQWIFIETAAQWTIVPKKETRNNLFFYFYANETKKKKIKGNILNIDFNMRCLSN